MTISMTDTLRYQLNFQLNPGRNTEMTCEATLSDTEIIESCLFSLRVRLLCNLDTQILFKGFSCAFC